eukprot:Gregarina_sp_Poly_1__2957@NODE_182_length_11803_cov_169_166752_g162_i0_p4_GENE_NODE_182_length_11803_cov_169_166752_g162_i0NODE_182_length_11803_cov_169_166752_g162_i0_p4_ORF_typecomplete_len330_score44_30DUF4239/PF14023_6/0_95DUF4239/PF14023_6/3_4e02DUF4239/PF14023_6/1_3Abhydrolase_9_N/PF15420_6/54Abhydrolase_9_N/PF15420_6/1_3e04Abhydrolase_9_N/PF15420_6/2_1e02Abhydrolase_9_N/PF15420_6/0_061MSP1a/PF11670_8/0_91MSP1a/PF11670_8/5_6e02_NODE_182_length_11803_cov_169_166752_g162_i022723261
MSVLSDVLVKTALRCVFWSAHGFFILMEYEVLSSLSPRPIYRSSANVYSSCLLYVLLLSLTGMVIWSAWENRRLARDQMTYRASRLTTETLERFTAGKLSTETREEDQVSEVSTCAQTPTNLSAVSSSDDVDTDTGGEENASVSQLKSEAARDTSPLRISSGQSLWIMPPASVTNGSFPSGPIFTMELLSKFPWLICIMAAIVIVALLIEACVLSKDFSWIEATLLSMTSFVTISNLMELGKLLWICIWDSAKLSLGSRRLRSLLWLMLASEAVGILIIFDMVSARFEHGVRTLMVMPYIGGFAVYLSVAASMFAYPYYSYCLRVFNML